MDIKLQDKAVAAMNTRDFAFIALCTGRMPDQFLDNAQKNLLLTACTNCDTQSISGVISRLETALNDNADEIRACAVLGSMRRAYYDIRHRVQSLAYRLLNEVFYDLPDETLLLLRVNGIIAEVEADRMTTAQNRLWSLLERLNDTPERIYTNGFPSDELREAVILNLTETDLVIGTLTGNHAPMSRQEVTV